MNRNGGKCGISEWRTNYSEALNEHRQILLATLQKFAAAPRRGPSEFRVLLMAHLMADVLKRAAELVADPKIALRSSLAAEETIGQVLLELGIQTLVHALRVRAGGDEEKVMAAVTCLATKLEELIDEALAMPINAVHARCTHAEGGHV